MSKLPEAEITHEYLEDLMVGYIAEALGLMPDDVDVDKPLSDFGLDSLAMLSLGEALEQRLARKLEPTLLWYYPTVRSLSEHLVGEWRSGASAKPGAGDAGQG